MEEQEGTDAHALSRNIAIAGLTFSRPKCSGITPGELPKSTVLVKRIIIK